MPKINLKKRKQNQKEKKGIKNTLLFKFGVVLVFSYFYMYMLCMVVVACVNEFKNSPLHYQMNTKTQQYHQLNKEKFSFSYFILFFFAQHQIT